MNCLIRVPGYLSFYAEGEPTGAFFWRGQLRDMSLVIQGMSGGIICLYCACGDDEVYMGCFDNLAACMDAVAAKREQDFAWLIGDDQPSLCVGDRTNRRKLLAAYQQSKDKTLVGEGDSSLFPDGIVFTAESVAVYVELERTVSLTTFREARLFLPAYDLPTDGMKEPLPFALAVLVYSDGSEGPRTFVRLLTFPDIGGLLDALAEYLFDTPSADPELRQGMLGFILSEKGWRARAVVDRFL